MCLRASLRYRYNAQLLQLLLENGCCDAFTDEGCCQGVVGFFFNFISLSFQSYKFYDYEDSRKNVWKNRQ